MLRQIIVTISLVLSPVDINADQAIAEQLIYNAENKLACFYFQQQCGYFNFGLLQYMNLTSLVHKSL